MAFRWPTTRNRTLILGSTGSGKSIFGAHVLSNQPVHQMPYVVIDYKGEEFMNNIPYVRHLEFNEVPKEPGVYILTAAVDTDNERMDTFLARIHKAGRIGLFLDEGFMVPQKPPFRALNAIYTQGRSKNIPVITLSQRPSWISRYAYSEADHIVYMKLNDRRDRDTVREFTPDRRLEPIWDLTRHPPQYHAKWYDVGQDESHLLLPAPNPDAILQKFEDRLRPNRRIIM